MELDALLKATIAKVCDIPADQVRDDTRLDSLGVDSLAVAEIIVEMEVELDVELPINVLRQLDRVETVRDVVNELQAAFDDVLPDTS